MKQLASLFQEAFSHLYNTNNDIRDFQVTFCSPEFNEDYTFLLFSWTSRLKSNPLEIGNVLGNHLVKNQIIYRYSVVKGFFNFSMNPDFWLNRNLELYSTDLQTQLKGLIPSKKYLVEYCSPNTNKPLHLGHIRNIVLGWSIYNILRALGHQVETSQIVNDRGIAICKSMLAWKLYADNATPESSGIKPDHFVGHYYVLFETKFQEEYKEWQPSEIAAAIFNDQCESNESTENFFKRFRNEYFNRFSILGKAARELLISWEHQDPEVLKLWKRMNAWVYEGFNATYQKLEVTFDHIYFESDTYLLGKNIVKYGLDQQVFYKESDGSVWIDLEKEGLGKKIILRSDGTSIYITQDLGTAQLRHQKHAADNYIYVVGDEQDYHFKVLFEILKKLEEPYAEGLKHLSYGMVDLPEGRMKSREGTVVDADDLIDEVVEEAKRTASERGELAVLSEQERTAICTQVGLAALKYFILKVNAKKRMIFNPKESVDMQGHTGPYIVNAFVRIKSILRKSHCQNTSPAPDLIHAEERYLLRQCIYYPEVLLESARLLDPSQLANYLYALAKDFHKYYHDFRILGAESDQIREWRLMLCENVAKILEHGMHCLGISLPERM